MHIAIESSPLTTQHQFRGIGWYTKHLLDALKEYEPDHTYSLFQYGKKDFKGVDIIHYPTLDLFTLTLPGKFPTKTVITIHDVIPLVFPKEFPVGFRRKITHKFQTFRARAAQAIITDSQTSKKDIETYLGIKGKKIHVIPLAATKEFKPVKDVHVLNSIKKKYELSDSFILYVGDINVNKNIPTLLSSFRIILDKNVNTNLVLVGDAFLGSSKESKLVDEQIKRLNIQQYVFRFGFVPTEDLVGIYNLARMYVQPSLYEGFGLPLIEAMSCGCPVVSSSTPALREIGQDALIYSDPDDSDSFAKGISYVFGLTEDKRRKMIEEETALAKGYTWEKTAHKTVEVYQAINTHT